jgi:putative tryptophan/tyrosine transport system substrate-binding protein
MSGMGRREFVALLGGAMATTWPLATRAQQPERMRRIGVLMLYPENDPEGQLRATAFRQGLQKLGWVVGRNVQIDSNGASAMPIGYDPSPRRSCDCRRM